MLNSQKMCVTHYRRAKPAVIVVVKFHLQIPLNDSMVKAKHNLLYHMAQTIDL